MAKDAVATMGDFLPDDAGGRDAVHVAVFSAVSNERLSPGQNIAVVEQREKDVRVSASGELVAIVDPFLKSAVRPGVRFWAYLYPRSITALSHRWSHPAFEASDTIYVVPSRKIEAEQRLRSWINSTDCPGYEWFIGQASLVADGQGDQYMHVSGSDAHGEIPDHIWGDVEIVLGRSIRGEKPTYFSCSC